ncbi:MAG TPA: YoaK family protein [Solirubrobacterales bacterium]|nr:YoaK family protein [Solirubrobacterales bacterium]
MWDSLTRTLLALTFVTGILDAVSFLALGSVFAAMQTGNVIFLGLGIGNAPGAPLVAPLIALAAFVAGGMVAALLARPNSPGAAGLRFALAVEIALLACAALLAALIDVEPEQASAYVLIALLSLAMGLRNTIARRVGDPNLATTVLNLTLTAFVTHTPTGFASQTELGVRIAAIAAIVTGAVAGALLLKASLALAIAAAALLVLGVALSTGGRGRRPSWGRSAPAPSR